MKLLKTIMKIIEESESQYNHACDVGLPVKEIDKLEKNYTESLKLLKLYNSQKIDDEISNKE
jgi:hypothetical protein